MPLGTQEFKKYLSIKQFRIRLEVPEGTDGAEKRKSTNPETGETIYKHELTWTYIIGKIKSLEYNDNGRFKNWNMEIDDGKEIFNLQFSDGTRYSDDILGKLPNVDFGKEVKISVYPSGKNKKATGVSMYQNDEDVPNYFVAWLGKGKDAKRMIKNGYPEPDGEMDADDFKVYNIKVRKFLRTYVVSNVIPKLQRPEEAVVEDDEDLPF